MTSIVLKNDLPFISADLIFQGQKIRFDYVLVDTGSASTIFQTDKLLKIGLTYEPFDIVHRIRGVGGEEFVFSKEVDELVVGDLAVTEFEIEVGSMDYGFEIEGILGMDFLTSVGALIDLNHLELVGPRYI